MKQIDFVLVVSEESETFYGISVAELRQETYKIPMANAIGQCLESLLVLPLPKAKPVLPSSQFLFLQPIYKPSPWCLPIVPLT